MRLHQQQSNAKDSHRTLETRYTKRVSVSCSTAAPAINANGEAVILV